MIVKILAIIFPLILFIFKYILPSMAEVVYNNTTREKKQIKIELMHFPIDLLFVAISYTIPKIVETTTQLAAITAIDQTSIVLYQKLIRDVAIYCTETVVMLMGLPFVVLFTKMIEKNYYKKAKRWVAQVVILYLVSMASILLSLFV